jgi:molybdopterin-biosynthesis enzyme MoeA-like protein
MNFGAVIIGDELLSGKRPDKHFQKLAELLAARGLQLSWVSYLGDDRARLTDTFRRTLATDDVVFSFGGIGNTPDDHTRQAAAAALGVPLETHAAALAEMRARFGHDITDARLQLVAFPQGVTMIPNPFNRIAGFSAGRHHFVPGFPQMAWPMVEWVLDTHYTAHFSQTPKLERAVLVTGENAYESALLDLMERIVASYPELRLFSLPSIGPDRQRRHLELGVEGAPEQVESAMVAIVMELEQRGLAWSWRPEATR